MGLAGSPRVRAEPALPDAAQERECYTGIATLSCLQKPCIMFCQRDPVTHQVSEEFLPLT